MTNIFTRNSIIGFVIFLIGIILLFVFKRLDFGIGAIIIGFLIILFNGRTAYQVDKTMNESYIKKMGELRAEEDFKRGQGRGW